MNKLTLKHCQESAQNIPVYGDWDYRGDCPVEDGDLASFFAWVRHQYPKYQHLIFHPENEWKPGKSGGSYAHYASKIAKGMVPRMGDVVCLPIAKSAPAFICELKRLDVSKSLQSRKRKEHFLEQIVLLESQKQHGNFACLAFGFDNLKRAFIEYEKEYGNGAD